MSSLPQRIFPTLAILVVAFAQVFGFQRGYACAHDGFMVETESAHCHRVMTDGRADYTPCESESDKDCGEQDESDSHLQVVDDLQVAPSTQGSVSIPAFVAVLISEISFHEWALIPAFSETEKEIPPQKIAGDGPSAALQVARCMVILI